MGGQYLDPHAAREAIEAIRNQGREAQLAQNGIRRPK
jgi:hypothetical protein